jgi:predicted enzyme related to lactoylglutathione lyase
MASVTLVEFPTSSAAASASFLAQVFGWPGTAYGPDYQDVTVSDGISLGFQGDPTEASAAPLVVIEVSDLDVTRGQILEAGGVITVESFDFPGGRRLHFREPGGNELAVWVRREG